MLNTCDIETDRLIVRGWAHFSAMDLHGKTLAETVSSLLTERVTRTLPDSWHPMTATEASAWIEERNEAGPVLLVWNKAWAAPIGFLVGYETADDEGNPVIRLGYVLGERAWGYGYATELVRAFLGWCRDAGVAALVGEVTEENVASSRVLEKCDFQLTEERSGMRTYRLSLLR